MYTLGKREFSKILSRRSSKSTPKNPLSPWAPFLGPQISFLYLGFPSSVLGHPKLIGPRYDLCGHLYSIFWPIVTIQYQCDTSLDIIWWHDFWPTAPLRQQNSKLCTLTSLGSWSLFKGTPDLDILSIGKYSQFKDSHDNPVPALHLTWRNMMPWYWVYGAVAVPNACLFVCRLSEIFDYYSKAIMI